MGSLSFSDPVIGRQLVDCFVVKTLIDYFTKWPEKVH